jgi:serine/threonine-protein kinase
MEKENQTIQEAEFSYFKTFRRISLVFFLGFTLFMCAATIILIFLTQPDKEIKVPDIVGKRFVNIHNSLLRNGLRPELKFRDVYDIEDGIILAQFPQSGSVVNENSKIKLTISRSSISLEVPNLIGTELPVAMNKLKNLHSNGKAISISTGVISYIPSETNADNIVIGQSPTAGERLNQGSKINLLVSSGKTKSGSRMPGITGQSIELCYDLLLSKNVKINEEIIETGKRGRSGTIISQTPRKGTLLKEGASVKIKVLWYPIKDHPYTAYEKVEYLIPENQKSGLYEAVIEDNRSKRTRFSAIMSPGRKIQFLFRRTGNAKIQILLDKKIIRTTSIEVEEYR